MAVINWTSSKKRSYLDDSTELYISMAPGLLNQASNDNPEADFLAQENRCLWEAEHVDVHNSDRIA